MTIINVVKRRFFRCWRRSLVCGELLTTYNDAVPRKSESTPHKRNSCPVGRALEIMGDRWTILILRDLLTEGARRFQELEASLDGISPNTLSARLKNLEEHGIVSRRMYEEHPPRAEYVLTSKGRQLGPAMLALRVWGEKYT